MTLRMLRSARNGLGTVAALVLLVGCGSGDEGAGQEIDVPGSSQSAGSASEAAQEGKGNENGEGDGAAEKGGDVAALEQVFRAYWGALTALASGDAPENRALLDGIATEKVTEETVVILANDRVQGYRYRGNREVMKVTVRLEGDTARLEGCLDVDGWVLYQDGEEVLDPGPGATDPVVLNAERFPDGWLISEHPEESDAELAC